MKISITISRNKYKDNIFSNFIQMFWLTYSKQKFIYSLLFHNFLFIFIFTILNYISCSYSCPNFPPLPPSTHSLRQSPHHCSCPWIIPINSLATPFPILYFTSHGYSVATYLYFLIPSPLYPFFHTPLPSGNHQNILSLFFLLA